MYFEENFCDLHELNLRVYITCDQENNFFCLIFFSTTPLSTTFFLLSYMCLM